MSHMSVSKIRIMNANADLLRMAVEEIVKEMKGELVNAVKSMDGQVEKDLLIAFKTQSFREGVGIRIVNGQVELVGDFWMCEREKVMLENELTKTYTAMALAISLKRMGYQVQSSKTQKVVTIVANR